MLQLIRFCCLQAGPSPTIARLQHALWRSEPWAELLSLLEDSAVNFACQGQPGGPEGEWLERCFTKITGSLTVGDPQQWFVSHGHLLHALRGLRDSTGLVNPKILLLTEGLPCFGEACRMLRMERRTAKALFGCFQAWTDYSARSFLRSLEESFRDFPLSPWLPTLLLDFLLRVSQDLWTHGCQVESARDSLLFLSEQAFLSPRPWFLLGVPTIVVQKLMQAAEWLGEEGWALIERKLTADLGVPFAQRRTVVEYCGAITSACPKKGRLPPMMARCVAIVETRTQLAECAKTAANGWRQAEQIHDPPIDYVCPITGLVMKDPVHAPDNRCYERQAIVQWLEIKAMSPVTRAPMTVTDLRPANQLACDIARWKLDHDPSKALKPAV